MKLLLTLLAFMLPAFAQPEGQECMENGMMGHIQYVWVCIPGHGAIEIAVCATPGSCPGSSWCPGNNGCFDKLYTPILKPVNPDTLLSLNTEVARLYTRKRVLTLQEVSGV